MKSNIIDIEGAIHAETERAILFSTTGEEDEAAWLPLSLIEVERTASTVTVTLPEQFAIDKGLV